MLYAILKTIAIEARIMFKQKINKWKHSRDTGRDNEIFRHLRAYWYAHRRKDLAVRLILETDFTVEELYEISNLAGQLAHQRGRTHETNLD